MSVFVYDWMCLFLNLCICVFVYGLPVYFCMRVFVDGRACVCVYVCGCVCVYMLSVYLFI